MDRPDNLESFKHKVHNHFMQYDRFRSRIIKIWPNYFFFEKVDAVNMVEVMEEVEEMAEHGVERFLEKYVR